MDSKLWIYLSDEMENKTLAVDKAIYFLSSSQASKQHSEICFHTAGNPWNGLNIWDKWTKTRLPEQTKLLIFISNVKQVTQVWLVYETVVYLFEDWSV